MIRIATFGLLAALALGCEKKSGPTIALEPPPATPAPPRDEFGIVRPAAKDVPPSEAEIALNDRLGKGVTPGNNAAAALVAVFGPRPAGNPNPPEYHRRLGVSEPPAQGSYFIPWRAHPPPAHRNEYPTEHGRRVWTTADDPDVASWLTANEKPLEVVYDAILRSAYYNPIVAESKNGSVMLLNSELGGVHAHRDVARALAARAMHRTGAGDLDGAWRDILACYRLARHVSHGGTMTEALVGMAVDQAANQAAVAYLSHDSQGADRLAGCRKDLEALPPMPGLADKLDTGERAFYLDALDGVRNGRPLTVGKEPLDHQLGREFLAALDWTQAVADGNAWYDRFAAALREPDVASRRTAIAKVKEDFGKIAFDVPPERLAEAPKETPVARMLAHRVSETMYPNIGSVQDAHDRDEQARRNVRIVLALAQHKSRKGKYPLTLAELGDLPADLFNGKPATYLPNGDGYLLYSVGVNGKDEAGAGDDLAVRVPVK